MNEPLLTDKELATYFQISTSTVANWKRQGVPRERIGRAIRFKLCDVLAWLKARYPTEVK